MNLLLQHEIKKQTNLMAQLQDLLANNKRVAAFKCLRDNAEISLIEAKDFILSMEKGMTTSVPRLAAKACSYKPVEYPDFVNKVQDAIAEKVALPSGITHKPDTCLPLVLENADLVLSTLGEFGKNLVNFARHVNIDHPSLEDINQGTFAAEGKLCKRIRETIEIAKLCRDSKFTSMMKVIGDWYNRNHKIVTKVLCKPPARLVKDDAARNKSRSSAKHKDISLNELYEKGRAHTWDALPSSFEPYCRMGNGFKNEIEYLSRMSEQVKGMGITAFARATLNDVKRFDELISDQYLGFIRMKLIDAAVIAAKASGAEWKTRNHNRILFKSTQFKPFWNCEPDKIGQDPYLSDVYGSHVRVEVNYRQDGAERMLSYTPRAYPLHEFDLPRPPRTQQIIDAVESHIDANGSPIFDNFWVVVPSVTVNTDTNKDHYGFRGDNGVMNFFEYWQYAKALDTYLVTTGQAFPIILGEHVNNKACYFVGYWA